MSSNAGVSQKAKQTTQVNTQKFSSFLISPPFFAIFFWHSQLRVKLAAVTTEAELLAVLDTLTLKERHLLGLPATQAITVSAEELKKMVSEFAS